MQASADRQALVEDLLYGYGRVSNGPLPSSWWGADRDLQPWPFDPDEARGLDDSLRRVADDSLGMVLVLVVALGLTIYGAFCVITSPARKVVATDEDTVAS